MAVQYKEYKVKKGDTLYNLTKQFLGEEKARELYQQYVQWRQGKRARSPYEQFGYGGVAERLPVGITLRFPVETLEDFKEVEQKQQEITQPELPSKPQPTGENSAVASFLLPQQELEKQFQELSRQVLEELKPSEEVQQQLAKERELTIETIQREAERAREEAGLKFEAGLAQIQSIRRQLYGPVNVEALKTLEERTNKLYKTYQLSLERINEQEKEAILKGDIQYAKQLRQLRLDYLNEMLKLNREYQSTLFRTIENALRAQQLELSRSREERRREQFIVQEAQQRLKTIIESYKGEDFSKLPDDVKVGLVENAIISGIPISAIEQMLKDPEIDRTVNVGDYVYLVDKKGNVVRSFKKVVSTQPKEAISQEDITAFDYYLRGYNVGNKLKMAILEEEERKKSPIANDVLGDLKSTVYANLSKTSLTPLTQASLDEIIDTEIDKWVDDFARRHLIQETPEGTTLNYDFLYYLSQISDEASRIFEKIQQTPELPEEPILPSFSYEGSTLGVVGEQETKKQEPQLNQQDIQRLLSITKELYYRYIDLFHVKEWLRKKIETRIKMSNIYGLPE